MLLFKYFMISAIYVCPNLHGCSGKSNSSDSIGRIHLFVFFCTSHFHCMQASTTVPSQDKDNPRGYPLKYTLKFSVQSILTVRVLL